MSTLRVIYKTDLLHSEMMNTFNNNALLISKYSDITNTTDNLLYYYSLFFTKFYNFMIAESGNESTGIVYNSTNSIYCNNVNKKRFKKIHPRKYDFVISPINNESEGKLIVELNGNTIELSTNSTGSLTLTTLNGYIYTVNLHYLAKSLLISFNHGNQINPNSNIIEFDIINVNISISTFSDKFSSDITQKIIKQEIESKKFTVFFENRDFAVCSLFHSMYNIINNITNKNISFSSDNFVDLNQYSTIGKYNNYYRAYNTKENRSITSTEELDSIEVAFNKHIQILYKLMLWNKPAIVEVIKDQSEIYRVPEYEGPIMKFETTKVENLVSTFKNNDAVQQLISPYRDVEVPRNIINLIPFINMKIFSNNKVIAMLYTLHEMLKTINTTSYNENTTETETDSEGDSEGETEGGTHETNSTNIDNKSINYTSFDTCNYNMYTLNFTSYLPFATYDICPPTLKIKIRKLIVHNGDLALIYKFVKEDKPEISLALLKQRIESRIQPYFDDRIDIFEFQYESGGKQGTKGIICKFNNPDLKYNIWKLATLRYLLRNFNVDYFSNSESKEFTYKFDYYTMYVSRDVCEKNGVLGNCELYTTWNKDDRLKLEQEFNIFIKHYNEILTRNRAFNRTQLFYNTDCCSLMSPELTESLFDKLENVNVQMENVNVSNNLKYPFNDSNILNVLDDVSKIIPPTNLLSCIQVMSNEEIYELDIPYIMMHHFNNRFAEIMKKKDTITSFSKVLKNMTDACIDIITEILDVSDYVPLFKSEPFKDPSMDNKYVKQTVENEFLTLNNIIQNEQISYNKINTIKVTKDGAFCGERKIEKFQYKDLNEELKSKINEKKYIYLAYKVPPHDIKNYEKYKYITHYIALLTIRLLNIMQGYAQKCLISESFIKKTGISSDDFCLNMSLIVWIKQSIKFIDKPEITIILYLINKIVNTIELAFTTFGLNIIEPHLSKIVQLFHKETIMVDSNLKTRENLGLMRCALVLNFLYTDDFRCQNIIQNNYRNITTKTINRLINIYSNLYTTQVNYYGYNCADEFILRIPKLSNYLSNLTKVHDDLIMEKIIKVKHSIIDSLASNTISTETRINYMNLLIDQIFQTLNDYNTQPVGQARVQNDDRSVNQIQPRVQIYSPENTKLRNLINEYIMAVIHTDIYKTIEQSDINRLNYIFTVNPSIEVTELDKSMYYFNYDDNKDMINGMLQHLFNKYRISIRNINFNISNVYLNSIKLYANEIKNNKNDSINNYTIDEFVDKFYRKNNIDKDTLDEDQNNDIISVLKFHYIGLRKPEFKRYDTEIFKILESKFNEYETKMKQFSSYSELQDTFNKEITIMFDAINNKNTRYFNGSFIHRVPVSSHLSKYLNGSKNIMDDEYIYIEDVIRSSNSINSFVQMNMITLFNKKILKHIFVDKGNAIIEINKITTKTISINLPENPVVKITIERPFLKLSATNIKYLSHVSPLIKSTVITKTTRTNAEELESMMQYIAQHTETDNTIGYSLKLKLDNLIMNFSNDPTLSQYIDKINDVKNRVDMFYNIHNTRNAVNSMVLNLSKFIKTQLNNNTNLIEAIETYINNTLDNTINEAIKMIYDTPTEFKNVDDVNKYVDQIKNKGINDEKLMKLTNLIKERQDIQNLFNNMTRNILRKLREHNLNIKYIEDIGTINIENPPYYDLAIVDNLPVCVSPLVNNFSPNEKAAVYNVLKSIIKVNPDTVLSLYDFLFKHQTNNLFIFKFVRDFYKKLLLIDVPKCGNKIDKYKLYIIDNNIIEKDIEPDDENYITDDDDEYDYMYCDDPAMSVNNSSFINNKVQTIVNKIEEEHGLKRKLENFIKDHSDAVCEDPTQYEDDGIEEEEEFEYELNNNNSESESEEEIVIVAEPETKTAIKKKKKLEKELAKQKKVNPESLIKVNFKPDFIYKIIIEYVTNNKCITFRARNYLHKTINVDTKYSFEYYEAHKYYLSITKNEHIKLFINIPMYEIYEHRVKFFIAKNKNNFDYTLYKNCCISFLNEIISIAMNNRYLYDILMTYVYQSILVGNVVQFMPSINIPFIKVDQEPNSKAMYENDYNKVLSYNNLLYMPARFNVPKPYYVEFLGNQNPISIKCLVNNYYKDDGYVWFYNHSCISEQNYTFNLHKFKYANKMEFNKSFTKLLTSHSLCVYHTDVMNILKGINVSRTATPSNDIIIPYKYKCDKKYYYIFSSIISKIELKRLSNGIITRYDPKNDKNILYKNPERNIDTLSRYEYLAEIEYKKLSSQEKLNILLYHWSPNSILSDECIDIIAEGFNNTFNKVIDDNLDKFYNIDRKVEYITKEYVNTNYRYDPEKEKEIETLNKLIDYNDVADTKFYINNKEIVPKIILSPPLLNSTFLHIITGKSELHNLFDVTCKLNSLYETIVSSVCNYMLSKGVIVHRFLDINNEFVHADPVNLVPAKKTKRKLLEHK